MCRNLKTNLSLFIYNSCSTTFRSKGALLHLPDKVSFILADSKFCCKSLTSGQLATGEFYPSMLPQRFLKPFYLFSHIYYCVKSIRIRSSSGPYFPTFGLNTNTDTFHAVYNMCLPERDC